MTYYRLAPAVVARILGLALVGLAVIAFVTTIVVAVAHGSIDIVIGIVLLGALVVLGATWWLRSRAWVVRCGEEGYAVRLVRGAGVRRAAWTDVADAVTTTTRGIPCLVLRLHDGGTTSIPVPLLAIDREEFVRQMQRHLGAGQRVRPLQ
ncbi:hypothetical protein [Nocardioides sp.]|jgi:hypothetical protein|uniref:hypothetical protein n=1 Tax=Nocardioides sp. TaxID=35761 RepID=UPI002C3E691F|nr:hypothetical protein [Nocardioides sp.]HVX53179.1 hypothetical protein [Nocardioides sp.]